MGLRRVIGAGASDTRVTSACDGETRETVATRWRARDQAGWVLGSAFGDEDELCARVSQPSGRLPHPGPVDSPRVDLMLRSLFPFACALIRPSRNASASSRVPNSATIFRVRRLTTMNAFKALNSGGEPTKLPTSDANQEGRPKMGSTPTKERVAVPPKGHVFSPGAAAAELREGSCWRRSPLSLGLRTRHDARRDFAVRVRLPDPALRADLRDFLDRWGCVTYEVNDDVIEVIVPGAPGVRQGRREFYLYLETWRAHHPGLELDLLD